MKTPKQLAKTLIKRNEYAAKKYARLWYNGLNDEAKEKINNYYKIDIAKLDDLQLSFLLSKFNNDALSGKFD